MQEIRNDNWSDLMLNIPPSHQAYWGQAKALKMEGYAPTPALRKYDNSIAFDDWEKVECLADIEEQYSDNPPHDLQHIQGEIGERFFITAESHPNPLIILAISYEPPPPYHFCRRPRNILSDPPDDLTVEVEKLIETNKMAINLKAVTRRRHLHAGLAATDEDSKPWVNDMAVKRFEEVFSPCDSDTPRAPGRINVP
ncbi:hypothetical protein EVAR_44816_1 [Eumeta japonica]|uniref:Uncharacterized protein n=1 Tax=Eumeta variegata TaxID=151549 RepID=A0A4C1X983_EUMVA|nr:hypothetical protein EVAR_44816_1 [Eumeta japonica]